MPLRVIAQHCWADAKYQGGTCRGLEIATFSWQPSTGTLVQLSTACVLCARTSFGHHSISSLLLRHQLGQLLSQDLGLQLCKVSSLLGVFGTAASCSFSLLPSRAPDKEEDLIRSGGR